MAVRKTSSGSLGETTELSAVRTGPGQGEGERVRNRRYSTRPTSKDGRLGRAVNQVNKSETFNNFYSRLVSLCFGHASFLKQELGAVKWHQHERKT